VTLIFLAKAVGQIASLLIPAILQHSHFIQKTKRFGVECGRASLVHVEVARPGLNRSMSVRILSTGEKLTIQYALDNHDEALSYALQFARDMDTRLAEKFIGMYVNHYTVDCGELVPVAAQKLLDMGFEAGLVPRRVEFEFVR
jgi:hypothetical protein